MGANNKSQKRPRGANAVTSKESSVFPGFFAPKPPVGDADTDPQSIDLEAGRPRVPLLGDELTKRESIVVHNLSTAYTWLVYDAIQDTVCCTICQAKNTTHHPNSTAENVFFSGNTKFTALSDQCVRHDQQYHKLAPAVLPPPSGTFGMPLKGTDPNQKREDGILGIYTEM
jgi:hypothetical protein